MAAVPAATASAAVAAVLASGGTESTEFLNDIVSQLWPYINVAGRYVAVALPTHVFVREGDRY